MGVQGLDVTFWFGLWAPTGTPKPVIAKLNAAVAEAFADPAVRGKFTDFGAEIPLREQQTTEAFGVFHKTEIDKWWSFIKAAGIKTE